MTNLISISDARANLPELITKVSDTLDRITITVNGQPKATLVSAEELEALEETAEVLSIPGAKKSILVGLKQAKAGIGKHLSELK
jgi:prevent-host-death family protein